MKWKEWISIILLALFVCTLFLPRLEISGERYISMTEDVNQRVKDKGEEDGEAVSSGAVSAAAVVINEYDAGKNREERVQEYDERIDEELNSRKISGLFLGKWALTVEDTLYFEGAEFRDDKKIEDSGVQGVFKGMGILIYFPVLFALVPLILCILNRRANEWLFLASGAAAGLSELFWYFMFPGMVWSKVEEYVMGFTGISSEVLHSDNMGKYTISSMVSHFSAWGHIVTIVFAAAFIIWGVLLLTVMKEKKTSFSNEMPDFSHMADPLSRVSTSPASQDSPTRPLVQNFDLPVSRQPAAQQSPSFAVPNGKVTCVAGEYQGCSFELKPGEEFVIGRDPKYSQLILQYQKISRRHCGIKYDARSGNYMVRDYSTNGTLLSGGGKVASTHFQEMLPGTMLYLATEKEAFRLD